MQDIYLGIYYKMNMPGTARREQQPPITSAERTIEDSLIRFLFLGVSARLALPNSTLRNEAVFSHFDLV
jgi:hypothetical protein